MSQIESKYEKKKHGNKLFFGSMINDIRGNSGMFRFF